MSALRFAPSAASSLRSAIREAGGVEVFAIGEVEDGRVVAVQIACRGTEDAVPALLERPRAGQVVIHNHPSGDLRPSGPDLHLAGLYGDDGVGVVIVDSDLTRENWVVEPHAEVMHPVDPDAVRRFFEEALPRALPGHEPRPDQLRMALSVAEALSEDRPLVVEAGTGTGKSLAYLVPAALWARANDRKVVISTFTKALQGQLLADDLPVLPRAGLDVKATVMQGRNNYLCKRRLGLAVAEDEALPQDDRDPVLADVVAWEATTEVGARADLPLDVPRSLWERVESDTDLTLRVRCPHYEHCHYYQARRRAAAAHVVVVNHALLIADLSLKHQGAPGILPRYRRLVIDEAHHLEDAATGALSDRLTLRGLQRATAPLVRRGKRAGVLERIARTHTTEAGILDAPDRASLSEALGPTLDAVNALRDEGAGTLEALGAALPEAQALRLTEPILEGEAWRTDLEPPILRLLDLYGAALGHLGRIHALFEERPLPPEHAPPIQELARARRRLASHRAVIDRLLEEDAETCRWLAPARGRGDASATLNAAPVRVARLLRGVLWERLPGTTCTSATLSVGGRFGFWQGRVGLTEPATATFPSPFDYPRQAVLALPRDLPPPDDPDFLATSGELLVEACRLSWGGTFVLCTSHQAVQAYAARLSGALPGDWPVLAQGTAGRGVLLRWFRESRKAVLVGTDSFWEGVSVRGLALRQVIVPRLPFRVPTEPLHEARVDLEVLEGRDPFRSLILPRAALRLRQGFGRLIRSQRDRGVVVLLDRRLHTRTYGRALLHQLPPARRLVGPWRQVRDGLDAYWEMLKAEVRWQRASGRPPA
jgi:ATP-dependent DNA helicase DinG